MITTIIFILMVGSDRIVEHSSIDAMVAIGVIEIMVESVLASILIKGG